MILYLKFIIYLCFLGVLIGCTEVSETSVSKIDQWQLKLFSLIDIAGISIKDGVDNLLSYQILEGRISLITKEEGRSYRGSFMQETQNLLTGTKN